MKGLIFSQHMYESILSGSKTMTRRLIKPQPVLTTDIPYGDEYFGINAEGYYFPIKPRYNVGETVYLKEVYYKEKDTGEVMYSNPVESKRCWNKISPMFMPEKYARNWIEIVSVKAERLQDISDEDIRKEGIQRLGDFADYNYYVDGIKWHFNNPREAFAALWDSNHKKNKWETNPWIWKYELKLIK